MIDYSSILYFIISLILLTLSYTLNFRKINLSKVEPNSVKINVTTKKGIQKGKKYLSYLLDQLKIALAEPTQKNTYTDLKQILPNFDKTSHNMPPFTLIYATQSNTAKRFAEKIASDSNSLNIPCIVKNISELSLEDFNRNILLTFFLSTYGEGGPSDDCIEFHNYITNKKNNFFENFSNQNILNYSIMGLGSSKYEYFNEIAKKFDNIFTKNKMNKICEIGLGDDSKNINLDFENWRKNFWQGIDSFFNDKKNSEKFNTISEKLNLKELYENIGEEVSINLEKNPEEILMSPLENNFNLEDYDFALKRFLTSEECTIENITELRKENINGSTLKITYSLKNTNLKYEAGDNIGVFSTNSEGNIKSILSRLNYDENMIINIKKLKNSPLKKKLNIPNNFSIKNLLQNFIDLSCQINKEILEKFQKFTPDEDQYEKITYILKNEENLNKFLKNNYNIVDFLTLFDSVNLSFIDFYNIMPKIIPRFYTVASSSKYHNHEKLEIIISLVEWKGNNNVTRYGLTSNYYKNIYENSKNLEKNEFSFKTRLIVRESSFKLPKDPQNPLIMICTGTGIAPFISFFQEFDHISKNKSDGLCHHNHSTLIFGSKNKKFDFIYENEINEWNKQQIVKNVYTAFSRDQMEKYYVQNIIEIYYKELSELILNEKSVIYICGGVSMGGEVTGQLEKQFTKEFVKKMEAEGRLIKELWG